jgi:hypothetical protein
MRHAQRGGYTPAEHMRLALCGAVLVLCDAYGWPDACVTQGRCCSASRTCCCGRPHPSEGMTGRMICPARLVASLGYKTDVPCLINGRSWSAARVLSGRCATLVVGPGGLAISRNRPRWHRVGLKPGIGSWPLWRRGDVGYVEQAVDRASSRVLAGAGVRLCAGGRAWASVLRLRHPSPG